MTYTHELADQAQFLLNRLEEYDPEDEDHVRDFHGHVAPAIARLRNALAATPAVDDMDFVNPPGKNPRTLYVSATPAVGGEALEEAREYVRNLWRTKALRKREHYDLIAIIDKAEKSPAAQPASPLRGSGELREALEAVAAHMSKDVQSGDSDLWTDEYDELHCTVVAALAASPPEQPDPGRDSIFDMCVMIVEEECYLDDPNGPIFKTGLAIRDRIKCAQRNRDKET